MLRAALRGGAAVSLLAKLLMPVGYMPGALADGGPVVPCGGLAAALAASSHATLHAEDMHSAPTHVDQAGAPAPGDHGHDTEIDHGPWERCALGGLASLVPLSGDVPISFAPGGSDAPPAADAQALQGRSVSVVRARGPPLLTA